MKKDFLLNLGSLFICFLFSLYLIIFLIPLAANSKGPLAGLTAEQKEELREKKVAEYVKAFTEYYMKLDDVMTNDCIIEREKPEMNLSPEYLTWQKNREPEFGKNSTSEIDYSDFLKSDIGIRSDYIKYAKQFLDLIDCTIIQGLADNGYTIILTDEDLAAEQGYSNGTVIHGITDNKTKTIRIMANKNSISRAIIHELGHAVCHTYLNDVLKEKGYTECNSKGFATISLHKEERRYIYEMYDELTAQLFYESIFYPQELRIQDAEIAEIYESLPNIIRNTK